MCQFCFFVNPKNKKKRLKNFRAGIGLIFFGELWYKFILEQYQNLCLNRM